MQKHSGRHIQQEKSAEYIQEILSGEQGCGTLGYACAHKCATPETDGGCFPGGEFCMKSKPSTGERDSWCRELETGPAGHVDLLSRHARLKKRTTPRYLPLEKQRAGKQQQGQRPLQASRARRGHLSVKLYRVRLL